jgi:serine/threonine protein kinase
VEDVEENQTKELLILKCSAIIPGAKTQSNNETEKQVLKRKKEIEEKKKKLEELIKSWKAAMIKSENVVKYIDHWYDDADEYSHIIMEYCSGGDLAEEIKKRIEKKKNFSLKVLWPSYTVIYILKRRCKNMQWK